MLKLFIYIGAFLAGMLFGSMSPAIAQTRSLTTPVPELHKTLLQVDSALFAILYKCKIKEVSAMTAPALEFFHDKSKPTYTREEFLVTLERNFCGVRETGLRRELVAGTAQVFPMDNYGALMTGEHYFYEIAKGQKEKRVGIAKFANLWQYKDGVWQISRVFSYDHRPAQ